MTPAQLAEILAAHRAWLRDEGGERANLSGAGLRGADLSDANLTRANLTRADLSDANLTRANLTRADLTRADLTRANLTRAGLRGANLSDANLTRTGLNYAQVTWTSHGECGRMLTAVRIADEIRLFCGCFRGTPNDLREYIVKGEERYRASRTRALEIALELMALNGEAEQ